MRERYVSHPLLTSLRCTSSINQTISHSIEREQIEQFKWSWCVRNIPWCYHGPCVHHSRTLTVLQLKRILIRILSPMDRHTKAVCVSVVEGGGGENIQPPYKAIECNFTSCFCIKMVCIKLKINVHWGVPYPQVGAPQQSPLEHTDFFWFLKIIFTQYWSTDWTHSHFKQFYGADEPLCDFVF